jgi:hypothetical protein
VRFTIVLRAIHSHFPKFTARTHNINRIKLFFAHNDGFVLSEQKEMSMVIMDIVNKELKKDLVDENGIATQNGCSCERMRVGMDLKCESGSRVQATNREKTHIAASTRTRSHVCASAPKTLCAGGTIHRTSDGG